MSESNLLPRSLLTATAVLAVAGFYGGLVRIGVPLPYAKAPAELHGLIMMQGVFGTLVPLERAVALRTSTWFAAPILSILATAALLAGLPALGALIAYAIAAAIFCCMSAHVVRLQPAPFTVALLLGAVCLLIAAIQTVLANGAIAFSIPWCLAYLVLTVAGERLELSRLMGHGPATVAAFFGAASVLLVGCVIGLDSAWGARCVGLGLLLLSIWLWRYDIALRTVRTRGQARFMAAAILCGHAWLGVAGLLALGMPDNVASPDALIHAITIGFTLSMVMGHALVILPAVAGVRIGYSPRLFAPLAILQAGVSYRVLADAFFMDWRWASGLMTVLALAVFAILVVASSKPSVG